MVIDRTFIRVAAILAAGLGLMGGALALQGADAPGARFGFDGGPVFLLDVGQVEIRLSTEPSDTPPRADLTYVPTLAEMAETWGVARLAPDGDDGRVIYEVRRAELTIKPIKREGGVFSFRFGQPDRRFEALIEASLTYEGGARDRRTIKSSVVVTGAADIPRGASLAQADRIYASWLGDLAAQLDGRLSDLARRDLAHLLD